MCKDVKALFPTFKLYVVVFIIFRASLLTKVNSNRYSGDFLKSSELGFALGKVTKTNQMQVVLHSG